MSDELQEIYDDAMLSFSMGDFDAAIEGFRGILEREPGHFDAQLSLGMAFYRQGDYERAIAEGHKAEALRPDEQLVHTNLSLFYMKSGDKKTAEHHGLQARIASWRGNMEAPDPNREEGDPDLKIDSSNPPSSEAPPPPPPPPPEKFPDMPWKKNKPVGGGDASG